MKNLLWRAFAAVVSQPLIANRLIERAKKTPYMHIHSPDGQDVYVGRWWLLNPYDRATNEPRHSWLPFSIRIHHIFRADDYEHCHDHPWDARTIILKGGYTEKRLLVGDDLDFVVGNIQMHESLRSIGRITEVAEHHTRLPGDTAALKHGEYHSITEVEPGGAVTLFITFRYQGTWGYLVDGVKIRWKTYLGLADDQDLPDVGLGTAVPCTHDFEPRAADGGAVSMSQPVIHICTKCGARDED